MKRLPPIREPRCGSATVEFACVAPLLFLLIFGIIEFGRLLMVQQAITNASYEGARRASLSGATVANVTETTERYLSASGVTNATITIEPDPQTVRFGQPVEVSVSVACRDVSWIRSPLAFTDDAIRIEATTTVRSEGSH